MEEMGSPPKRVLMVLDHPFPHDVRVENEATALIAAGYDVAVLSVGPDKRPAVDEHMGIRIFRDRISRQRLHKMRGLAGTFPFMTRHISRRVRAIHDVYPFDVVHIHDLYLFGGGIDAARSIGCPAVGDLHENWVEALRGYAWSSRLPGRLFINFDRWQQLEEEWTKAVDRLIVVIEEAAARHLARGVPPARITVVSNTLNIEAFESRPVDEALVTRLRSALHLVYVGGFDLHRGLDTVVEAMPYVLDRFPGATLTLVGDGRVRAELEAVARQKGLERAIHFAGWQPEALLKSYMMSADVCLVPHRRTPHTDATIPHKLFQYMYCAKPVIVSNCLPLQRIVGETEAGLVFEDGDAGALAGSIQSLVRDPEEMHRMGVRGREAVIDRYNWNVEAKKLAALYEDLFDEGRD